MLKEKLISHLLYVYPILSDYNLLINIIAYDPPNIGPDSLLAADVGEVH